MANKEKTSKGQLKYRSFEELKKQKENIERELKKLEKREKALIPGTYGYEKEKADIIFQKEELKKELNELKENARIFVNKLVTRGINKAWIEEYEDAVRYYKLAAEILREILEDEEKAKTFEKLAKEVSEEEKVPTERKEEEKPIPAPPSPYFPALPKPKKKPKSLEEYFREMANIRPGRKVKISEEPKKVKTSEEISEAADYLENLRKLSGKKLYELTEKDKEWLLKHGLWDKFLKSGISWEEFIELQKELAESKGKEKKVLNNYPWIFRDEISDIIRSGKDIICNVFSHKDEFLGKAFLNSFVVTLPSTFLPISIAAFAALAFAWMKFPLRLTLFAYIVGFLTIPLQATVVPILRVYNKIGLSGTFVGIWFVHTGWGLPLLTYFLYNFFREFPHELIDAASVDGASSLQVFVRVIVPLSVPALASITIFQFLWVWNDLFAALLFLGGAPEVAPLTVALSTLVGSRGQGWELLTAAAFISSIVPLTIFFSLQRYFVRGILAGAIKA